MKGDPLGFVKLQLVAKYEKKLKGDSWEILKNSSEKYFSNEIFEQCHSAEKYKRDDPLGFFDIHCVEKYRNKRRGDPLVESKKFQKGHIVPKKNPSEKHQKRDPMFSRIWTSMFLFWTRF